MLEEQLVVMSRRFARRLHHHNLLAVSEPCGYGVFQNPEICKGKFVCTHSMQHLLQEETHSNELGFALNIVHGIENS